MMKRISDEWLQVGTLPPRKAAPSSETSYEGLTDKMTERFSATFEEWVEKTEKMISANPSAALAIAAGLGIVIGWWVKRK